MAKKLNEELRDLLDWSEIFYEAFRQRVGADMSGVKMLGILSGAFLIVVLVGVLISLSGTNVFGPVLSKILPSQPSAINTTPTPTGSTLPSADPSATNKPTATNQPTTGTASPTSGGTDPSSSPDNVVPTQNGSDTSKGQTPIASFTSSDTKGQAPATISFTDLSTNSPTSWYWDFGDGSTSDQGSPTHTYNKAGTYTVTLEVTNPAGSNSTSFDIDISDGTETPTDNTTPTDNPTTTDTPTPTPTVAIGGSVTDEQYNPLAATVIVSYSGNSHTANSNPDGSYSINVPMNTDYTISAQYTDANNNIYVSDTISDTTGTSDVTKDIVITLPATTSSTTTG